MIEDKECTNELLRPTMELRWHVNKILNIKELEQRHKCIYCGKLEWIKVREE